MTDLAAIRFNVTFANRQRSRTINLHRFRSLVRLLLGELLELRTADLGISLVAAPEMARLNETFLQHAGSTDVITFDYADHVSRLTLHASGIQGEIIICVDEAITQARRFHTTWQSELVRYVVHGVLHLLGHDDRTPAARRTMKRAENRLLRSLAAAFDFRQFSRPSGRRLARKS